MKRKVKRNLSKKRNKMRCNTSCSCGGGVYFFGFIGAIVYYIQNATSFGNGVLGFLKAIVWPAILIYKLFGFLYGL
ncbi:MAG: hypothetical protein ABIA78_00940 [archaeon]